MSLYNLLRHSVSKRCWGIAYVSTKVNLTGVFPPIITPFNKEEKIDYGILEKNINTWNDIPFKDGTLCIII
ncbi:HOGA1 [Cordylochernes scorpioides]|uniref:HOGA1 n=1 Tax=Cordylochernes scorpioides TaxID=51811 RepID=A0ABY6L504_9ARAC|nr:HOGA1 [Cordylochernes scorpioides]